MIGWLLRRQVGPELLQENAMVSLKEASIASIRRLPDECSVEDIMYRVELVSRVLEGLRDMEQGRVVTTEEVLRRIETWDKSSGPAPR